MNVTIEITVRTKKVGSDCTVTFNLPKDWWDEMDEDERNDFCFETLLQSDLIDWNYEIT